MMDVVGELRVHLRAHRPESAAKLAAAEQFCRRVLSRAAEYVQAQAPGRIVLVDALRLGWRLREGRLDDEELVERWAVDLYQRLTSYPPAATLTPLPPESGDVVAFADEAQWRAAHFLARSRGSLTGAWFFAALDQEGPPVEALAALARSGSRELVWQVLTTLAAADVLVEVLQSWPPERLLPLTQALVGEGGPELQAERRFSPTLPPAAEALLRKLQPLAVQLPRAVLALAAVGHLRAHLRGVEMSAMWPLVGEVLNRLESASAAAPAGPERQKPPPEGRITAGVATAPSEQQPPAEVSKAVVVPVELGGLFFLLNCALELNVGEILWQACLPESLVLAKALAVLVGEEGASDPALALWTGVGSLGPLPDIDSGQQEEVSRLLLRSLAAALPRRGLAALPEVELALTSQPGGKLLVAAAADSPLVIFAWPADTGAATKAGLQAFLENWPVRAPGCQAAPGLAQLDDTGRVQAGAEVQVRHDLLLTQTGGAQETALLAQVAGSLGYLFAARLAGGVSGQPRDFLERYLHLPARVRIEPESLTVMFQADQIDLAVRRAGLDKDSGWVAWLRRRVGFEYGDEN